MTGTTDFALEFGAPYTLDVSGSWSNWTADASDSVSITYDYVPVPEPSALFLPLSVPDRRSWPRNRLGMNTGARLS